MELPVIVSNQVLVMLMLMGVGFFLQKKKIINEQGASQMSEILLKIVTPAVIINSYNISFDKSLGKGLLIALGMALLAHIVPILITALIYRGNKTDVAKVEKFGIVYSNCGFMALPLITAVAGQTGVFYASAFIIVFNILQWTHGASLLKGSGATTVSRKKQLLSILLNPGTIGSYIGLLLFLTPISLPSPIATGVSFLASLNTPLAMIVVGSFIARADILKSLKQLRIYGVCAVKLLVVPAVMVALNLLLHIPNEILIANILAVACPCAASTSIFVSYFGGDAIHGSKLVAISTVLSILTIPLISLILGLFGVAI